MKKEPWEKKVFQLLNIRKLPVSDISALSKPYAHPEKTGL